MVNLSEKLNSGVTVVCGTAVFLLLPSVDSAWLMNGSQSGKTFFFLYLVIIITLINSFRFLSQASTAFRLTLLDKLLATWVLYVIGNGLLHGLPINLCCLDFFALVVFYISLRQLSVASLYWLYFLFIIGGGIQAVQGNLQLWGWAPPNQNLFKVTGSFFNPGPYSGYLANVLIAACGFYFYAVNSSFFRCGSGISGHGYRLYSRFKKLSNGTGLTLRSIVLVILFIILLALSASISRASFLAILSAAFYLVFSKYGQEGHVFFKKIPLSFSWRVALAFLVLLLIVCMGGGLYYLNQDSANGRKLIWTVSLNMINDNPVFGTGFEHFKSHYMNYQAAYFKGRADPDQAMVAGDTTYAFNEILQMTVENGVVGLVLFVWISVTLLKKRQMPASGIKPGRDILYTIAKACLISVFTFSLFSYPSQILPIKTGLVLAMATISKFLPGEKYILKDLKNKGIGILSSARLRFVFLLLSLCVIFTALWKVQSYVLAYRNWRLASENYLWEDYATSVNYYHAAYAKLTDDGDFLTAYGKALSMAKRHREAIIVLKQAAAIYPNTVVFIAMGDSYKALHCYDKAEEAYLHSMYMNPSRLFPKYLLVKLYLEWGHKKDAIYTAGMLLKQPIKVESTAVRQIREEMRILIPEYKSAKGL